jgi:hypothetical protein
MNDNQYLTLNELLARIDEPYQKVCKRILNEDAELMLSAIWRCFLDLDLG